MGCSTSTVSHSNEINLNHLAEKVKLNHLAEKVKSLNDLPGEVRKPGRSVTFDKVYVQEFVVDADAGEKAKMVDHVTTQGAVTTATLTPEESLSMLLQMIEAYPHILEKKVANKRWRDFGSA